MNLMMINVSTRRFGRAVRLPEGDVPAPGGAGVSKSAREAVEKAGGNIELIEKKDPAALAAAKKGKTRDAKLAAKAEKKA